MGMLLLGLMVAYVVVQARLLYQLGSGWRVAAGVPLVITVPALAMSILGLIQQSNLWPLPLLFASPFALVGLIVVWILYRAHSHGTHRVS